MRDSRKFNTPKILKYPKTGDFYIKLKDGSLKAISPKEYRKIKKFFKIVSVQGAAIGQRPGCIKAKNKLLEDVYVIFSPEEYNKVKKDYELIEIVSAKTENIVDSDLVFTNNIINQDAIFDYSDLSSLTDSWNIKGFYGITTYEYEDEVTEERKVIILNGKSFIIKSSDYTGDIANHWEVVETISVPVESPEELPEEPSEEPNE